MATETTSGDVIVDKNALELLISDFLWVTEAHAYEYNQGPKALEEAKAVIAALRQRDV